MTGIVSQNEPVCMIVHGSLAIEQHHHPSLFLHKKGLSFSSIYITHKPPTPARLAHHLKIPIKRLFFFAPRAHTHIIILLTRATGHSGDHSH